MEIREIERVDAVGVGELALRVYDESPISTTFSHRPSTTELATLFDGKIAEKKKKNVVDFVAVEGRKVAADCEIIRANGSEGMVGIIVAKEERRRGLGRRLLETCETAAKHIGIFRAYAKVNKENGDAVSFFSKCGYSAVGGKRGNKRDTLLLSKSLLP